MTWYGIPKYLLAEKRRIEDATPKELQVMLDEYHATTHMGDWCVDWIPWAIHRAMRGESLYCSWVGEPQHGDIVGVPDNGVARVKG